MEVKKIDLDPDFVVKALYAFLDKKHTTRIAAFLAGITEESKKNIPVWMLGNIEMRLKGEPGYIDNYFFPSVIKKRVESVVNECEWLGFININGGNANLDVLLHTVKIKKQILSVIERIYFSDQDCFGEVDFFIFIEKNEIKIKSPRFLGFLNEEKYFFCFHEYISGGRHASKTEVQSGLIHRVMHHLWSFSVNKDLVFKRDLSFENLKNKTIKDISSIGFGNIVLKLQEISENSKIFILHHDLHGSNLILMPDNDFYLIDWVSWSFSHVGMGVNLIFLGLEIDGIDYEKYINLVFDFYDDLYGVSKVEFISNFTFFNVVKLFDGHKEISLKLLGFYKKWCLDNEVDYE